jgi:DtxR family Mn-dependent transcriptional regulator
LHIIEVSILISQIQNKVVLKIWFSHVGGMASSTVENYLKAILLRSGEPGSMVPTGTIAEALGVVPGTSTTMVKSMAAQGLVEYHARTGVRLTAKGRALALAVLRKHRLIELFLVQVLKMDWAEVHEEAEALEHAISDRVLERLDTLLGHPNADPHGDPIPNVKHPRFETKGGATLATCAPDKFWRVARITDQTPRFLAFVQQTGLKPGARVRVMKRDRTSGVVHCDLRAGGTTALGLAEASKIEVAEVS